MLRKKEIMPKVMVYRGCFDDLDRVLKTLKDTEDKKGSSKISDWRKWLHLGTMAHELAKNREKLADIGNDEVIGSFEFEVQEALRAIRNAYHEVALDYANQWGESDGWPEWIKNFDLKNNDDWNIDRLNILKYNPSEHTGKYAMNYHTDNHEYEHGRGSKWTLTVTMYLNDDYEGGDISFLNEFTGEVLEYKPKAGDITVFPSFAPYYHAVHRVDKGNKYLVRMFWHHKYPGTEEWLEQEKKYGADVWAEMEHKRKVDGHEKQVYSKWTKYIVLPGQKEDLNSEYTPFFAKENPRRVSNDW